MGVYNYGAMDFQDYGVGGEQDIIETINYRTLNRWENWGAS